MASGEYLPIRKVAQTNLGVSMTTLRVEFKKHIQPLVREVSKYGTHSMKSGTAANLGSVSSRGCLGAPAILPATTAGRAGSAFCP